MRSSLMLLVATLLASAPVHAQHGFWQPDDRVLITSFTNARGIATDQRLVFIATTNGLEIYDQIFRRWQLPSTIEDGYPAQERPARIAYDARERGVWLVTELGNIYAWSTAIQRWEQRFANEVPNDVAQRLQRSTADRDPAWAVMRNFAGRDAAGRNWQVTGIDAGERSGTFWAATNGGNFSFVDTRNLSSEPYTYGTISRGVSVLALADGTLWFGGDGASPRNGIARADTELQRWQHFESRIAEGPRGRVHAMLAVGSSLFAGAADGLYLIRGTRVQRVLDAETHALARTTGRTWVGTRGTLGYLDDRDAFNRIDFPLQTVHAMTARNDTLWIAAEAGLYRWTGGGVDAIAAAPQVVDVALAGNTVVTVTSRGVQVWNGSGLALPLRNNALPQIGRPLSVSSNGERVWVGGTIGLAEWNMKTDAWRYLSVPNDIPEGPVYDVVADGDRIWLATPAGALRLNWD